LHYSFGMEQEIAWVKEGANLIVHSSDFFLVRDAIKADLNRFRDALGESKMQGIPKETGQDVI